MERGIQASIAGLEDAKKALKLKGWTQEYLAGAAGCSRKTVTQFLARRPIEKRIFQALCSELDLEWGTIAELESGEQPNQPPSLDELVETVRVNLYDTIQTKCGSMRVLDMSQPINLNAIYTTVNILEKITGRRRLEMAELLQNFSPETFERFSLSDVQEAGVPGLDAVNKYAKLMILGKPGVGKTTFLKHVALQCIEGAFKPTSVPLFITLKDFAEAPGQPGLLNYCIQLFETYGIAPDTNLRTGLGTALLSGSAVKLLLRQGSILMLLDGLDEVKESDSSRVLQQIQGFTTQFAKNPFVITCRIAAREYTFERFVEVEVADFDDRQIATFATQWFQAKNEDIRAAAFIKKVIEDRSIRELATSPLLLTLLCLAFKESGSFPVNRSELYEEGLDALLKKWDESRDIERDQVYKKLSLKCKEDLLSQIALETFELGNYFFKQKEAERYITHYIRNLPSASTDEEALQLDSEAVLKSIEAQHGLFVERARGLYSFSHLTFHEYFAARKIVTSANADTLLHKLTTHITEKRWREVFLLTVGMLESADALLQRMKAATDQLLADDKELQQFLYWANAKAKSVEAPYKPVAVRACYYSFDHNTFDGTLVLDSSSDHALTFDLELAFNLDQTLDRDFTVALSHDFSHPHANDFTLDMALELSLARASGLEHSANGVLTRALTLTSDPKLKQALQTLKEQIPDLKRDRQTFQQWWKECGHEWIKKLRAIMIKHRNIGHTWQFNEAQSHLLQQHYEANKLLVSCLNSDCHVSRKVREEIETSLLLPLAESKKSFPNQRRPQPS